MKTMHDIIIEEFNRSGFTDVKVCFILTNDDDEYVVVAYDKNNPEKIFSILADGEKSYITEEEDWVFILDEYLFKSILDEFELNYMPIEEHIRVWLIINNPENKFYYTEGLKLYLTACLLDKTSDDIVNAVYKRN